MRASIFQTLGTAGASNAASGSAPAAKAKAGAANAAKGSSKDVNKSDVVAIEAAQILQGFDDLESVFEITEAKLNAVLTKVNNRLTPAVVSACCEDLDGKGVSVVSSLRLVKSQLAAAIPLAQSLASTQGEAFHPDYLQTAMEAAEKAQIKLTPTLKDVLAVRHLTFMAENMDWSKLVDKLEHGLKDLDSKAQEEIGVRGIICGVESVSRLSLPAAAQQSQVTQVAEERLQRLSDLAKAVAQSSLPSKDCQKEVCEELSDLDVLCNFVKHKTVKDEEIGGVEKARTMLLAKTSNFLRALSMFPLGVWLMDQVQEGLAAFHAKAAVLAGLTSVNLGVKEI